MTDRPMDLTFPGGLSFERRDLLFGLHTAVLPLIGPADRDHRRRLPGTARYWVEVETTRRINSLRESGVVIHGTLDDLTAPDDAWETEPTEVADTDLLDEALRLLAASHPDRN